MTNGEGHKITVSEERLNLAIATLKLEITNQLTAQDERSRARNDEIKALIAGNPETIAGIKAGLADVRQDVDYLSRRDWWGSGISLLLATFFAWLMNSNK